MSSFTPTGARMSTPWGPRLTPSNSPFYRPTTGKSPTKMNRNDANISLKQVVGTTANSPNALTSLSSTFAFTAGAAIVSISIGEDNQLKQRFYRARPTAAPVNAPPTIYDPSTPTNSFGDTRNRNNPSLREVGLGLSPFTSPSTDWSDSPTTHKSWAARERVKAATCVAFSPDGKFLAVGETGYKPRVLVFSAAEESSSDTPLTCLYEHTFGVQCVAFSPDSRYLATLGAANDGFLYVWNINPKSGSATLHASNKCTSSINQVAWVGNCLVTVGTRHVKVWRTDFERLPSSVEARISALNGGLPAASGNKTLPGRNSLLGPLLEGTFTSVAAISATQAIVCSDKGDICLLDDSDGQQQLAKVTKLGYHITAVAVDSDRRVHFGGRSGNFLTMSVDELLAKSTSSPASPAASHGSFASTTSSSTDKPDKLPSTVAMAPLSSGMITIDSQHSIKIMGLDHVDQSPMKQWQQVQAHGNAVLGVRALLRPNDLEASFVTWANDGSVLFWDGACVCKRRFDIPLGQTMTDDNEYDNELRVVRTDSRARFLISGDRQGVLRVLNIQTGKVDLELRAHDGEITDIEICEGTSTLMASSGRDRMVQLFGRRTDEGNSWTLLQTLDEHVGAVTRLLFTANGDRLLSCSSDRTIVVRESGSAEINGEAMTAYFILRTITLKATPTSMAFAGKGDQAVLVSTIDRFVHQFDIHTGRSTNSFKATDADGNDAVVISSLVSMAFGTGLPLIAAVSGTDKSVRIYDENGCLTGRDWGHTEGITDIASVTVEEQEQESDGPSYMLVTVAADGTIFVWSIGPKTAPKHDLSRSLDMLDVPSPANERVMSKPPLRRVLSQSELAFFQRSTDDESQTPTGHRPPNIRRKTSRFSLAQTPRLDPSPMNFSRATAAGSRGLRDDSRRSPRHLSPSPPLSPKTTQPPIPKSKRPSMDIRSRTKSTNNIREFGSLLHSSEQVCRTLRAYRKKLANSSDGLGAEMVKELERELGLTARAVGEKVKSKDMDEAVMAKILDQYTEKLVERLDEKFAERVARQMRAQSEGGTPLDSPAAETGAEKKGDKSPAAEAPT